MKNLLHKNIGFSSGNQYEKCCIFGILLIGIVALFCPVNGYANQVILAWDSNQETDIAGYRIYYHVNVNPKLTPSANPKLTPQLSISDPMGGIDQRLFLLCDGNGRSP
jgi:hypothetical protein